MAGSNRPDQTGDEKPGAAAGSPNREQDLVRRSRELDAALAARKPARDETESKPATGGMAGFGQALKLSSEFIAGIAVGAGLGWLIDRVAGTSPWGLIIFLLLGFAAGVLNVLRSVGMVAEGGPGKARNGAGRPD
ncbi:AtpZ/AtpI family protein [Neoaquamicrobium sediminum]|uniref:AtpZ/AtpI family protein n=1 Tax=Neoaquamicrobium sediminum TaxID=1849104 RepID=UPI00156404C3|nr:AtpZ/AtpI family protein [Mesorhizobium sediminum]NRC52420.1 ATP F0F1 synthase subunit I [Mesorhizobium sediminum]